MIIWRFLTIAPPTERGSFAGRWLPVPWLVGSQGSKFPQVCEILTSLGWTHICWCVGIKYPFPSRIHFRYTSGFHCLLPTAFFFKLAWQVQNIPFFVMTKFLFQVRVMKFEQNRAWPSSNSERKVRCFAKCDAVTVLRAPSRRDAPLAWTCAKSPALLVCHSAWLS